MPRTSQIVAMGGLSPETAGPLFRYVLEQAGASSPRVGFLPTASGDAPEMVERFHELFDPLPCRPSHLGLFGRVDDPEAFLAAQDVVLVGGGNTKSMLGLWREWGLDALLREAWESGVVMAGFSAGAICWFEQALCDSWAGRLAPVPGLGFLPGSCCPHYDAEADRRPVFQKLLQAGSLSDGIAIDDHCAVHFHGAEPRRVVAAAPGASAYAVRAVAGGVEEVHLDAPRLELPGASG